MVGERDIGLIRKSKGECVCEYVRNTQNTPRKVNK